jgi:ubiquinol-cytochrome c reductase iron-sulfur subunit
VRALRRWLVAAFVLLLGRGRRRRRAEERHLVEPGPPDPSAELVAIALLGAVSLCAVGFVVVYAVDRIPHQTQFLGLSLGLAFAFLAAAALLIGNRLVSRAEHEEDYPPPASPAEQEAVTQIVEESASRFTRKRLIVLAAGGAGTALGAALVTPALSLGPAFDVDLLRRTPWRRGIRLVDEHGRPYRADEIETETFYTAYPQGANPEEIGSPLVVVRLEPVQLALPRDRHGWAPDGIVAYSKICTHAGCAIALYRKPTFPPTQPRPALVCPCHYSTFDPSTGGTVLFGPAGRPLPQLPLAVDGAGRLVAAGPFSGPIGPSWWGVRMK